MKTKMQKTCWGRRANGWAAFILTELFVVIAILAGLLLPAPAQAEEKGKAEKPLAKSVAPAPQRGPAGPRDPGRLAASGTNHHALHPNYRALHLVLKKMTPDGIKALISQAKDAGFNTLVLALADEVRFDAFTNSETATWSKAEFMGVVEYARQRQLEVIPELALLTHQGNFLKRSRPDLMFNAQTYDPRKSRVYEIVFPILDELIAWLHPRAIHIGHDEAVGWTENHWKKGLLQPGEQQLPAALFLDDVKRLHGYLQKKGVETWMWGDMLIAPDEFPTMTVGGAINGRTPGYGKMLRQKIPRDIVICDWHYIGAETNFSSVAAFQADGFRVLGATWENPTTIRNFSRSAAAQGAEGMIATTWFHVRSKQPDVVAGIIRESGAAFRRDFPDAK